MCNEFGSGFTRPTPGNLARVNGKSRSSDPCGVFTVFTSNSANLSYSSRSSPMRQTATQARLISGGSVGAGAGAGAMKADEALGAGAGAGAGAGDINLEGDNNNVEIVPVVTKEMPGILWMLAEMAANKPEDFMRRPLVRASSMPAGTGIQTLTFTDPGWTEIIKSSMTPTSTKSGSAVKTLQMVVMV
mmetsp:Transcript_18764/g.52981  ORF Transcript_18764/g.52981 Transcript_18764/m.52981 type:complete len:188 (+) Transcript_18764:381-944(+)